VPVVPAPGLRQTFMITCSKKRKKKVIFYLIQSRKKINGNTKNK
jgi:hypothetical protein